MHIVYPVEKEDRDGYCSKKDDGASRSIKATIRCCIGLGIVEENSLEFKNIWDGHVIQITRMVF